VQKKTIILKINIYLEPRKVYWFKTTNYHCHFIL